MSATKSSLCFNRLVKLNLTKSRIKGNLSINECLMKTAMQRQWAVTCATPYLGKSYRGKQETLICDCDWLEFNSKWLEPNLNLGTKFE